MSEAQDPERGTASTCDREYFSDFDFTLRPPASQLEQVLSELVSPYLDDSRPVEEGEGCLALLPVQTGLGKTYSTLALIIDQMLAPISRSVDGMDERRRTIIYVTDSIDNTRSAYYSLLTQIDEQRIGDHLRFNKAQRKLLKSRILYLPSQANQLADCEHDVVERLIELFAKDNKALHRRWRSYRRMATSDLSNSELADELHAHQANTAQEIYSVLLREIRSSIRDRQQAGLPLITTKEQTLLDQLLPAERLRRGDAHVLFMTTSKYFYGCDHAIGKYLPILDLKGQLLLIDEIDRQNGEILKLMVRQEAIDLISVVRTLHANLRIQLLDTDPLYRNIAPMFEELALELDEYAEKWHIECAFDVDGIDLTQNPLSLFSDRTYTHVHSFHHQLNRLRHEAERQKNLIDVVEFNNGEQFGLDKNGFSGFVNRADQLYQRFVNIVRQAVFMRLANARKAGRDEHDGRSLSSVTQQVVSSVLHHYNLAQLIEPVLAAFNARSLRSLQQDLPLARRSYHGRGFKFVEVKRNRDSHDTVATQFNGLLRSPTGMLAEMVEGGAIVVGISATAEAQTVVHNFDMHYIQQRLGDAFRRLSGGQRQRLHDYYHLRRNYCGQVNLDVSFHRPDDHWLEQQLLQWRPVRNARVELNRLLAVSDQEGTYARGQLSKVLQAIHQFVAAEINRYMVILRNSFIRFEQNELQTFIDFSVQRWAREHGTTVRLFHKMNAASLRADAYKEVLDTLQNTKEKVVVFTSYSTMGVGKNPDYPIGRDADRASLIWVGEGKKQGSSSDIDSMYLEKPTYLLPGSDEDLIGNRLMQFHNVLVLQEQNELTIREARNWVSMIMQGKRNEELLRHYHRTNDYIAATRKTIEQAVGRTARTAYKRRRILLLVDCALESCLAEDDRDERLFSHEYLAIRNHAKSTKVGPRQDIETRRRFNMASRHTENSRHFIHELLKRLRHPRERDIRDWVALRMQTLRSPTSVDEPADCNWLYIQHLHGSGDSYRYQGDPDHSAADLQFFNRANNGSEISAEAASLNLLMQNTHVLEFFRKSGFATTWENGSWLLNPLVFQSIYLAALGEQATRAVLEAYGVLWKELPAEYYERFDGLVEYQGVTALLDVKNWRSSFGEFNANNATAKIREVCGATGVNKVVYLRLFGPASQSIRFMDDEFCLCSPSTACVIEIPALLDDCNAQVIGDNLISLFEWLGGTA